MFFCHEVSRDELGLNQCYLPCEYNLQTGRKANDRETNLPWYQPKCFRHYLQLKKKHQNYLTYLNYMRLRVIWGKGIFNIQQEILNDKGSKRGNLLIVFTLSNVKVKNWVTFLHVEKKLITPFRFK